MVENFESTDLEFDSHYQQFENECEISRDKFSKGSSESYTDWPQQREIIQAIPLTTQQRERIPLETKRTTPSSSEIPKISDSIIPQNNYDLNSKSESSIELEPITPDEPAPNVSNIPVPHRRLS